MADTQEWLDRFYFSNGPCCAGCDWWRSFNTIVGECRRNAPVPDAERWSMMGIQYCSLNPSAGHAVTPREHHCGEFKDEFDWASLPLPYRKRIGAPVAATPGEPHG